MPASHQDELIISVARNHRQVFRTNQEAHVGREGNVRIGADDVNLHRVMFVVWHNGSTWMIGNKSSYLPLTITPNLQHSHAVTTMGPKSVTSLPPGESRITFSTQNRSYTVMVLIPVHVMNRPSRMRAVSGDLTVLPQRFNEEQEQLLKILAKFQHNTKEVPPVKKIAATLGWTDKKTNQKIERLAKSLAAQDERLFKPYRQCVAEYAERTGWHNRGC